MPLHNHYLKQVKQPDTPGKRSVGRHVLGQPTPPLQHHTLMVTNCYPEILNGSKAERFESGCKCLGFELAS